MIKKSIYAKIDIKPCYGLPDKPIFYKNELGTVPAGSPGVRVEMSLTVMTDFMAVVGICRGGSGSCKPAQTRKFRALAGSGLRLGHGGGTRDCPGLRLPGRGNFKGPSY